MKIKIYNKFELAQFYYPESSKHVALNHLMRLVNQCQPLLEALKQEGYKRLAKTFTMRQTLLIYEYLGGARRCFSRFLALSYRYCIAIVLSEVRDVVPLQSSIGWLTRDGLNIRPVTTNL